MNRNLYFLGIFFIGLYVALALFQSIIHFQLGAQIFYRQSFLPWFKLVTITYFVGLLVLLKYYQHKKYWITFSAGIIFTIASSCYFILIYDRLVTRELVGFYIIAYLLLLGVSILYSVSLIFSNAGERPWLKAVGILGIILQLVLVSTFFGRMNFPGFQLVFTLEKIRQWASLAYNLLPFLFIINFLGELRLLKKEHLNTTLQKSLKGIVGAVGIIALVSALILGRNLVDRKGVSRNLNKTTERAKRLAKPFEERTYVNSEGDTMFYRLMKPPDYDPKKKYPLVVCLHSGAGWGTDNIKQIEGSPSAKLLSRQYNREKYPAFLFVPQCPPGFSWGGGIPNHPGIDSLVFETIGALQEEFGIDVNRQYVMGISLGGYGSWHFISTRPKMFAAAIPISGGGNPKLAKHIIDVPVWAFHGEKDRNVPVRLSRDMIEAIKNAGGNPLYNEFPNAGHNLWNRVNETPGKLDWLFAQKRD